MLNLMGRHLQWVMVGNKRTQHTKPCYLQGFKEREKNYLKRERKAQEKERVRARERERVQTFIFTPIS